MVGSNDLKNIILAFLNIYIYSFYIKKKRIRN